MRQCYQSWIRKLSSSPYIQIIIETENSIKRKRNYERGTRKERGMVKNVYNGWKARCKIKYGLKPWQVMFTISVWKLGLLGENNTWNKLEKHICFSHTFTKWSQCTRNYMSIKIQCPWQFSDNRRYFSWYLKITRLNLDDSN